MEFHLVLKTATTSVFIPKAALLLVFMPRREKTDRSHVTGFPSAQAWSRKASCLRRLRGRARSAAVAVEIVPAADTLDNLCARGGRISAGPAPRSPSDPDGAATRGPVRDFDCRKQSPDFRHWAPFFRGYNGGRFRSRGAVDGVRPAHNRAAAGHLRLRPILGLHSSPSI